MIDFNMPVWFQIIQIIGWSEILILFVLTPFENKHEYIYKAQRLIPDNFSSMFIVMGVATPMIFAGIYCCFGYFIWFAVFYYVTY